MPLPGLILGRIVYAPLRAWRPWREFLGNQPLTTDHRLPAYFPPPVKRVRVWFRAAMAAGLLALAARSWSIRGGAGRNPQRRCDARIRSFTNGPGFIDALIDLHAIKSLRRCRCRVRQDFRAAVTCDG